MWCMALRSSVTCIQQPGCCKDCDQSASFVACQYAFLSPRRSVSVTQRILLCFVAAGMLQHT